LLAVREKKLNVRKKRRKERRQRKEGKEKKRKKKKKNMEIFPNLKISEK
jgi:hypothetical protein